MNDSIFPIAAYFAANKFDSDAVESCFTKDATVKDEGRTYNGIDSIKQWKAEASTKYTYTSDPFALEQKGGYDSRHEPVDRKLFRAAQSIFDSFFRLERGKVAFLEIIP